MTSAKESIWRREITCDGVVVLVYWTFELMEIACTRSKRLSAFNEGQCRMESKGTLLCREVRTHSGAMPKTLLESVRTCERRAHAGLKSLEAVRLQ